MYYGNREDSNQPVNLFKLENSFRAYRFLGSDYTDTHAVQFLQFVYV